MRKLLLAAALSLLPSLAWAQAAISVANDGTTGTALNAPAKYTTANPMTVISTAGGETSGLAGIVVGWGNCTGATQAATATTCNATIARTGQPQCRFDTSGAVSGNWVINSATANRCADSGVACTSAAPTGKDVLGCAMANAAASSAGPVDVTFAKYLNSSGSGSPGGSSNSIQYNNGGAFGGIAVSNNQVLLGQTSAAPVSTSISGVLDVIGSTRGSILERGASGWVLITPGTSGTALVSNGTGADPTYQTVGGSGCTVSGAAGAVFNTGSSTCTTDTNITATAGALSLGASGTVGTLAMGNATTGTVTLGTVTGALGSVTASLPANTGTVAELNLNQAWTAGQAVTPDTATSCGTISTGGTATPNFANSNSCQLTFGTGASATMTIANPTNVKIGQDYLITIAQNTSGSGTVTFGNVFNFGTVGAPTLTTTASKVDQVSCYAYAASGTGSMHCILAGAGF